MKDLTEIISNAVPCKTETVTSGPLSMAMQMQRANRNCTETIRKTWLDIRHYTANATGNAVQEALEKPLTEQ